MGLWRFAKRILSKLNVFQRNSTNVGKMWASCVLSFVGKNTECFSAFLLIWNVLLEFQTLDPQVISMTLFVRPSCHSEYSTL